MNLGTFFDHYSLAFGMSIPISFALYEFIINKNVDTFLLTLGLLFFVPALITFIYFGPKQLKLKKISLEFDNDQVAFTYSKETFDRLGWQIISSNNKDFISALRPWPFSIGNSGLGQEVSVFIESGRLYIVSLHYPNTQAQFWYNRNSKNVLIFEKEMKKYSAQQQINASRL